MCWNQGTLDSVDTVATRCGLEGSETESGRRRNFREHPDCPRGQSSFLYNDHRIFPGGKADGSWKWSSTASSNEVGCGLNLYIHFLSVTLLACHGFGFLGAPNTTRMMKSGKVIWAGHVARTDERRGAYRVLVENSMVKRPRHKWEDNIKVNLKENG